MSRALKHPFPAQAWVSFCATCGRLLGAADTERVALTWCCGECSVADERIEAARMIHAARKKAS